jgi:DNA-binding response OmpR family regulator
VQPERVYPVALIVHPDAEARSTIVRNLRDAGFQVVGVDTFEAARHMLLLEPVTVLVTEARLGDFHGLHLVLLARCSNPSVFAAVLTAEEDEVLQREVENAGGTLFVAQPAESIVSVISRRVAALNPDGIWN